ncbi:hypothetical protein [Micromonospora sp. NPDC023956]|uniref:hypothetical protein n=1 Tax=Micromonospora sp. NPDC023956 TaxID=3155722 RepID=UPI0033D20C46
MRKTLLPFLAVALVTGLACGSGGERADQTSVRGAADRTADADHDRTVTEPAPATTRSTTPATVEPLTCGQLKTARLGSASQPYQDHTEPIRLRDGLWSEDGVVVQLQWPCAVGELTGDNAADAVVPVLMDGGGTGKFWQIALFRNVDAEPAYLTMVDIGDRTPIEKVTISAQRVRVEFLMRPEDPSSSVDVVRRTAVYQLDGNNLVEIGYFDGPA